MAGHTLLARVELSEPHFGRELIGRAPLAPPPIRTPASMDATTSTITFPSTSPDTDFTRELPCTSSRPLDRIGRAGAWSLSTLGPARLALEARMAGRLGARGLSRSQSPHGRTSRPSLADSPVVATQARVGSLS